MAIKLLNEKRINELIQFINKEEITKEYLKQNHKIIYINEEQEINGIIIFDAFKNEIELCLGNEETKQRLINVIKKIAFKDITYQNKTITIPTKQQFKHYEEVYTFIQQQKDRVYSLDNFKKYMQEVKKDPESEKLLTEYKMTQVKVQNFTVNDQKDQKRNLAKFESLKKKVFNNKKLSRYLNSEQQFTSMMAHINQILSQAVENDYK